MIDHDLSDRLHSLATTVDEPFDLVALHRRISMQRRRRAVVRVGFAGAGVAALVGGLFVVREQRPGTLAAQTEPAALPACDVVLTALRAATSTNSVVPTGIPTDKSSSAGDVADLGFKGIVTILTIDGPHLTFHIEEPKDAPATTGTGTVDATTVWVDGPTPLETPPTLQVGERLSLATTSAGDGVDHVVFVDVGDPSGVDDETAPGDKPTRGADSEVDAAADTTIVVPGATLPPGPTNKSRATITAVDATSITVTLDDAAGQATALAIDVASTAFYAGDTRCLPGPLTVGTALGVAYHFGDTGHLVADSVLLVP